jgi:hypothetical protein
MRKSEDDGYDKILELLAPAWGSSIIKLIIWSVFIDTFFGVNRAIKEHKFSSSFGIDSALRKIVT